MTVKKSTDDLLQRHIDTVTGFLATIQARRYDLTKKLYELQKQDIEFEKLLQVSLLRLISATDIDKKPPVKDSNAYQ